MVQIIPSQKTTSFLPVSHSLIGGMGKRESGKVYANPNNSRKQEKTGKQFKGSNHADTP